MNTIQMILHYLIKMAFVSMMHAVINYGALCVVVNSSIFADRYTDNAL